MLDNDEILTKKEIIEMLEYTTPDCLEEEIKQAGMSMEEAINIYVDNANRQSALWGYKPIFTFMDGLMFNLKWIEEEKKYVYCSSDEFFQRLGESNVRIKKRKDE